VQHFQMAQQKTEAIMQTPGFFHQFPELQPNDKYQEGLKAEQQLLDSENSVSLKNRLLLYTGEILVTIGKRLKSMSGTYPTGQAPAGMKESTV
jgi:hypothetical protein